MMGKRIKVKVMPNSAVDEVTEGEITIVKVRAPAEKGKANVAVMKLLSKHFGCRVKIIAGFTSRKKLVELET
jgi:uncharacterized protein (TIGR00251 family)